MQNGFDIAIAAPDIGELEMKYVTQAVKSNEISSGYFLNKFEEKFRLFCEASNATSCTNGTVALHLALIGAGVKEGDEVIVPALTYVATANAVIHAGGVPVFVDINPDYWGLDPEEVKRKITPRTKAVIAVHLYGHPADMDPLIESCRNHNITLIEDCAEAHGARYKGKRVGGIAPIGTFSFYGNKILTTGEGGIVTCEDESVLDIINIYKNHGNNPLKRYQHQVVGYNYRMTNIQAAIGLAQVERVEELLEKRSKVFQHYLKGLESLPCEMQPTMEWAEPVSWMNCLVLEGSGIAAHELQEELKNFNIETRPFFTPLPRLEIYNDAGDYPIADNLSSLGINLPSSAKLSYQEVDYIIDAIEQILLA